MKEVLKYFYDKEKGDSMVKTCANELWFNMGNYWVVIKLSSLTNLADLLCLNLDEDDIPDLIKEIPFENLSKINIGIIESVIIQSGEYISDDEEESDTYNHNRPYSYITAEITKRINLDFPDAITFSKTESYCVVESLMCPELWEYGSRFFVSNEYWNNTELYDYCTSLFDKAVQLGIPMFYQTTNRPKDNYEIKVLSSNTKARRLGYLKILMEMFKVYPKISIAHINTKFESFAHKYKDHLDRYKNNKGEVIRTKTGNSAKPYIELAEKMGLIHKIVGYYSLGKDGKLYNEVKQYLTLNNQNPFVLDDFDTIFFMELLLKEDYLYLYTIITLAHRIANISYNYLKSNFKAHLLKQCELYIENIYPQSFEKIQSIKNRTYRIRNWEKPDVYMEHVIMPRLNWLYDMDFISLNQDLSFDLTSKGKYLCYNLWTWNDINSGEVVSSIWFIDNYFMQMIDMVLGKSGNKFNSLDFSNIKKYIDNSFSLFKTLAPNRVTFSQMSKYVRYMLYLKENKLIEAENIKNIFGELEFSEYIYRYQKQYEDGYVQKNDRI